MRSGQHFAVSEIFQLNPGTMPRILEDPKSQAIRSQVAACQRLTNEIFCILTFGVIYNVDVWLPALLAFPTYAGAWNHVNSECLNRFICTCASTLTPIYSPQSCHELIPVINTWRFALTSNELQLTSPLSYGQYCVKADHIHDPTLTVLKWIPMNQIASTFAYTARICNVYAA